MGWKRVAGDIRGKPLDERGLAHRLRQYSIRSVNIQIGETRPKGYRREDFVDAWDRYLPPFDAKSATCATNATSQKNSNNINVANVADDADVADASSDVADDVAHGVPKNVRKYNGIANVADVALLQPKGGSKCAQCSGHPDGKEQQYVVGGQQVWLHPECKPFWAEGDGWGVRR